LIIILICIVIRMSQNAQSFRVASPAKDKILSTEKEIATSNPI